MQATEDRMSADKVANTLLTYVHITCYIHTELVYWRIEICKQIVRINPPCNIKLKLLEL